MITIQQALRPLLITCFILGLSAYPMKQSNPRNRWIVYLSILYRLIIWFSYAYLFYYVGTLMKWRVIYQNNVYVVITALNIFITIKSVVINFCHQKKFKTILEKLSVVNNSLEELGIPKMYSKMHSCLKLIIIGWIVYSIALNFCDTMLWAEVNDSLSWELFVPHVLNHTFHVNVFVELLFTYLFWYIGSRFDKINEHIRCSLLTENYRLRYTWKKSIVSVHQHTLSTDYRHIIWTSMHLHLELCQIARELNFIFGTQIIFGMASYLLHITALCYGLCIMLTHQMLAYLWFHFCCRMFILIIRVYAINYICESVMVKAKEIDKIISELTNTLRYANIKTEIYQFTLQVMHHPLKLTGMGLFYLGNVCLKKFCITILTFVIVMVQMKIQVGPKAFKSLLSKEKIGN